MPRGLEMRLLVTRPEPEAQRTAAMLAARGHRVRIASLLKIEPVSGADIGSPPWQAVLLTSANAARTIALHPKLAHLRSIPVLAVGRRTAEAARAAGFTDVTSADGSGGDLERLVASRFAQGAQGAQGAPLLYLAGSDRARDVAADLAPCGIAVRTVELYRAHAAEAFPAGIVAALRAGGIEGVLHFSRRSAEIFVQCAGRAAIVAEALRPLQFCISAQTAEPLARAGADKIRIAAHPEEDALVALIGAA
jgi:uroporphyrinogen-III synthase